MKGYGGVPTPMMKKSFINKPKIINNTRSSGNFIRKTHNLSLFQRSSLSSISSNIEDKESIVRMRPMVKSLLESTSDFLTNNSSTPKFRELLQKSMQDVDRYFTVFFNHLTRAGVYISNVTMLRTAAYKSPMIKQTSIPFVKAWSDFSRALHDIHKNGVTMIQDSIEENFDNIMNRIEMIQNGQGYNAGMHDPVVKKAKKVQQKIWIFLDTITKYFADPPSSSLFDKLIDELKVFSRDLNSSFSSDFSQASLVFSENERARNIVYNNACDVIFQVKSFTGFEVSIGKVIRLLDDFDTTVRIIAENLDVTDMLKSQVETEDLNPTSKKASQKGDDKDDDDKDDSFFSKTIPISELIDRGFVAFKRSSIPKDRVREFFDTIRFQVNELENRIIGIKQEMHEKDQQVILADTYKELVNQEQQKVIVMKQSLDAQLQKVKSLETELSVYKENTDLHAIRECLLSTHNSLAIYLNKQSCTNQDDSQLIRNLGEYCSEIASRECPNCATKDEIFQKLEGVLGSKLFIEEAQKLVNDNTILTNRSQQMTEELDQSQKQCESYKDALKSILELFGVAPQGHVELDKYAVVTAQEQISLTQNKYEIELEKKENDIKKIGNMIEKTFNIPVCGNIDLQLQKLKTLVVQDSETIDKLNYELGEVIRRLKDYLSFNIDDNIPPPEAVRALLNELENDDNPIKRKLDSVLEDEQVALNYIGICERNISSILKQQLPEYEGIVSRTKWLAEMTQLIC